jgi:hypothetical protein
MKSYFSTVLELIQVMKNKKINFVSTNSKIFAIANKRITQSKCDRIPKSANLK